MSPSTHRTRIKICGLTREADVDAAVAAGADAIGFVLYPKSPRFVAPARAAELARRLPPFVTPVLLFVNENAINIEAACAHVAGATMQFHGDESAADCVAVARTTGRPFMRAARIPAPPAAMPDLVNFAHTFSAAQAILLDATSTATAAAERHSIGHAFHQTYPLTSSCLVGSHLQT